MVRFRLRKMDSNYRAVCVDRVQELAVILLVAMTGSEEVTSRKDNGLLESVFGYTAEPACAITVN